MASDADACEEAQELAADFLMAENEALRVPIPARDRLLRECWAMAEQPRALDSNRIGEGPLTRLSADEMAALEQALRAGLGWRAADGPCRPAWILLAAASRGIPSPRACTPQ